MLTHQIKAKLKKLTIKRKKKAEVYHYCNPLITGMGGKCPPG